MIARLAAGSMFVAAAVTGVAGVAAAAGNNGTVKLGSAGQPFTNANNPHLTCPIQIQWSGFDAGTQTFDVAFTGINPTGGTVTPASDHGTFDGSTVHTETYSLSFTGAVPHNGEYHVGIDINTTAASGSDFKQKTIWVQGCAVQPGTLSLSGHCNAGGTGYDWSVGTAPSTTGLDVDWTSGAQNGTVTTGAAGTAPFSTTGSTAAVTANGWTGSGNVQANPLCVPPPSNLQLTAACSAPGSGVVLWTVTNPNAVQVTGVSADPNGDVTSAPATTIPANGTTTFTTNAPGASHVAHGSVGAANVTSNALAFAGQCAGQQETPATVVFTDTCAGIHGVFTSADQHTTHFDVTKPDGTHVTVVGSDVRDFPADAANPHISTTFDNNGSASHDWTQPAGCVAVTPADVDATATCDGFDVVFTSASDHTTDFDVTKPDGTHETVSGDNTASYAADAQHKNLDVAYDGTSESFKWTNPGGCNPAGQADPGATTDNSCADGISVVLSNINGTADVTFTVVDPDANTHQVPVRAGQLVKESYPVAEDTTGTVTITAPGMAKQTATYHKNCTKVLGEKDVKNPPETVVEGEKVVKTPDQLPFTGFEAKRSMMTAAGLLLLGSLLCGLASVRRRTAA